jgi:hypothetical protein
VRGKADEFLSLNRDLHDLKDYRDFEQEEARHVLNHGPVYKRKFKLIIFKP